MNILIELQRPLAGGGVLVIYGYEVPGGGIRVTSIRFYRNHQQLAA